MEVDSEKVTSVSSNDLEVVMLEVDVDVKVDVNVDVDVEVLVVDSVGVVVLDIDDKINAADGEYVEIFWVDKLVFNEISNVGLTVDEENNDDVVNSEFWFVVENLLFWLFSTTANTTDIITIAMTNRIVIHINVIKKTLLLFFMFYQ